MPDTHERNGGRAARTLRDESDPAGASAPEPSLARRMAGASSHGPFGPDDLTDAPPDDPGAGRVNAAAATLGSPDAPGREPDQDPEQEPPDESS